MNAGSEKTETDDSMLPGVLIVIPQTIHVLVSSLAITNSASKWFVSLLRLALHLSELSFCYLTKIWVGSR
jgi:hypothetical protein